MDPKTFSLWVVFWTTAFGGCVTTADEVDEYGHCVAKRDGTLKKLHSPVQGRPPPSGRRIKQKNEIKNC